jgi:hypothetical protein
MGARDHYLVPSVNPHCSFGKEPFGKTLLPCRRDDFVALT